MEPRSIVNLSRKYAEYIKLRCPCCKQYFKHLKKHINNCLYLKI